MDFDTFDAEVLEKIQPSKISATVESRAEPEEPVPLSATAVNQMTPSLMVQKIVKLKALKKRVDDEYKLLQAELLKNMVNLDVYSLKTGSYTVSRTMKHTPQIDDAIAIESLTKMNVPVVSKTVLDMDLMKLPLEQLRKEGKQVDGVTYKDTEFVSIRLKK